MVKAKEEQTSETIAKAILKNANNTRLMRGIDNPAEGADLRWSDETVASLEKLSQKLMEQAIRDWQQSHTLAAFKIYPTNPMGITSPTKLTLAIITAAKKAKAENRYKKTTAK